MDDNRIEQRLDKIDDRLGKIEITLGKQHESLKAHMKRSDALEAQVEPLKDHLVMLRGVMNFIKFVATIAAIVECIRLFR